MLIAFDVDGSLSGSAGPITPEMINRLNEKGIFWGILSSRSPDRAKMVTDEMKVQPRFTEVCRVYQRCEEMLALSRQYGFDPKSCFYIADTENDEIEAKLAGFNFIHANDFSKFVENLLKE